MSAVPVPQLLDRDAETRAIEELLDEPTGRSGLVLAGEAGVGTTALLRTALRMADERRLRVITLTPAEAVRPFGVLAELLVQLDEPAVGPRDPGGAAAHVAALLAATARRQPTLLMLDDLAAVDDGSWDVLAGAARRLRGEPVVLLAAGHSGDPRLRGQGLDVLPLRPLGADASAELLARTGAHLPAFVRARVLEACAGNPLGIVELATVPSAQWSTHCVRAPVALPMPTTLVERLSAPLRDVDELEAQLLLAAAANDGEALGDAVAAVVRVTGAAETDVLEAASRAVARRAVECDGSTLRFRTEVMRSTVYRTASLPRRHAIHGALAVGLQDRPARAAWHRAAASLRPDERLATALEAGARDARDRGELRVALAKMDRAVRFSQSDDACVVRLLAAAELSFEIGRPDFVSRFVRQAASLARTPDHHEQVAWIQNLYDLGRPDDGRTAVAHVRRAERALADGLLPTVRTLVVHAGERARVTPANVLPVPELLAAAERLGGMEQRPMLAGLAAVAAPLDQGERALAVLRAQPLDASGDPRLGRLLGHAAVELGDDELAVGFLSATAGLLRMEGRFGMLPHALHQRGWALLNTDGLPRARADIAEAARLADETGQTVLLGEIRALEAVVEAVDGDPARAERRAGEAERVLLGRPAAMADVHMARGAICVARGRYDEAFDWFARLWDDTGAAALRTRRWLVADAFAEAAVWAGRVDEVRPYVARLEADARRVPSAPRLAHAVAFARAITTTGDGEAQAYATALAVPGPRGPMATARLQLAHGMWLRRRRRIVEARRELRAARAAFDAIGAAHWADRAGQELRAAGDGTPVVVVGPGRDELTPQELQIAEMAASGLSNREIGQRLYLSHRTIGSHLYRVFPKLGVTNRAQLRDALTQARPAEPVG
ncbi:helix-turn-helix transcriptional regulator [Patulibacter americanus]|uniref:helix-turn-helix transcriptional regulator n=1 Tax=Patulibacter americanus TaxID=588672 RepID=UPI0003B615F7|nr:LuxR family transcriptional regulator [Patulibacter americanus]